MKPIYIIAEAGVNHNGDMNLARKLIEAGADAGVDAVKFQTFVPEKLVTAHAEKAAYQKETTGNAESQLDMLRKLSLQEENYLELQKVCNDNGVDFISTPFDTDSLNFLTASCEMPFIKLPSGEITNAPFLLEAAKTGQDIVLSTGMSTLGEIEQALGVLAYGYLHSQEPETTDDFIVAYSSDEGQDILRKKVRLLHCTTQYPASYDQVNLRAMDTMRTAFGLAVGYSDHTHGIVVPVAAAAMGAVIIEKHFTLDRNFPGPDHKASLEPDEMKTMVEQIRIVEAASGDGIKKTVGEESENKTIVRKSIVAACDIRKGDIFTEQNITAKRPAGGKSPFDYWKVLGTQAERDYHEDDII